MKPVLAAILSVSSFELTDDEKYLLEDANPVGVSLFKRNLKEKEQIKSLIKSIKETIDGCDRYGCCFCDRAEQQYVCVVCEQ